MAVNLNVRDKLPNESLVFDNHAYDNSIIGVTLDDRVIYAYELMVQELINDENWDELDAIEWIEYNTIRSIPYAGKNAPIIVHLDTMI